MIINLKKSYKLEGIFVQAKRIYIMVSEEETSLQEKISPEVCQGSGWHTTPPLPKMFLGQKGDQIVKKYCVALYKV